MKLDTKALENHGFNFLKSQYLDDYEINNLFTGVKSTKHTSFAEIAEETFDTIETVLDEHLVTIAHAAISPMHLMEKPLIDAKLEAIDLLSETIKCNPVLINEICTFVSLLNYYKKGTVAEPHGEIFITYFKSDEGSIHVVGKEFERLFNERYEYKTDKMLYSRDQFNDFKIMLYEEVKQVYDRNNKKTDSDYLKMITDLLEKMDLCGTSYEKARVISLHKIMTKYGPQEILKKYKLIDSISNENLDMFIKHCEYLQKYKKHCRAVSVFSPLKLKYKNMSLLGESGKHIAENEIIARIGDDHDELDDDSYDDIDYALSKVVEDNKHKPSHVIEYYKTSPIRPILIDITKNRNMKDTVKVCKESKFCNDSHPISLKIKLCEDILSSINFDKYMRRAHTATNILLYYLKNQELLETYPVQEQTQTVEKKSFVREVMNRFKKLF